MDDYQWTEKIPNTTEYKSITNWVCHLIFDQEIYICHEYKFFSNTIFLEYNKSWLVGWLVGLLAGFTTYQSFSGNLTPN